MTPEVSLPMLTDFGNVRGWNPVLARWECGLSKPFALAQSFRSARPFPNIGGVT